MDGHFSFGCMLVQTNIVNIVRTSVLKKNNEEGLNKVRGRRK